MVILLWMTENVPAGLAVVNELQIETLTENNPDHKTRNIAELLHISDTRVVRYLQTFG